MAVKQSGFWSAAVWGIAVASLAAQGSAPARPAGDAAQEKPTFRVSVDAVTQDVVVKDDH